MASSVQVQTMFEKDPTLLRTPEQRDTQVAELEAADKATRQKLSTEY